MIHSFKIPKNIKTAKKYFKQGFELWYYTGETEEDEDGKEYPLMSIIASHQDTFKSELKKNKQYYL